jgi:hypothetical protein
VDRIEIIAHGRDELGVRLWVKPRASKSRLLGVREGAVQVAVAAPAVEGRANEELIRFLARQLAIPRSDLTIAAGAGGRKKLLRVRGLSESELRARLSTPETWPAKSR